jgi:hypothetical protein
MLMTTWTLSGPFLLKKAINIWGYCFRGSLLSRLAVATLHLSELDIALDAIETRRVYERQAIQSHELAVIVRGLIRNGKVDEARDVLEDKLRLPMDSLALKDSQEVRQRPVWTKKPQHTRKEQVFIDPRSL